MRCRHPRKCTVLYRLVYPRKSPNARHRLQHLMCNRCGEWLPLGEANDEPPEVQLEVLAADIAAEWTDEGHAPGIDRFDSCPIMTKASPELCNICLACFLAREIVTTEGR